jgi:bifunctional DNA-binding transcriptional regulator/antitoxin component of YhaV-PrlF toxin-antitoxin module
MNYHTVRKAIDRYLFMNNQGDMKRLTAGLTTKSDKIRALGKAGYARQQIADFLGIRYQHVRNVLVDAERKSEAAGLEESKAAWRSETPKVEGPGKILVQADGSVVVPASVLAEAGFDPGDRVVAVATGEGEIHLMTRATAIRHVQQRFRTFVPEGVTLVDELIAERRREAAKEERDAMKDKHE